MAKIVRHNPFDKSDLQALRQAIEPMGEFIKIIGNTIQKFNEKGRPENITEEKIVWGVIQPYGDLDIDRKGGGEQGEWMPARYLLTLIHPDFVRRGDYVEHEVYGRLRVSEIKPKKRYGTMSAVLSETRSAPERLDKGEIY